MSMDLLPMLSSVVDDDPLGLLQKAIESNEKKFIMIHYKLGEKNKDISLGPSKPAYLLSNRQIDGQKIVRLVLRAFFSKKVKINKIKTKEKNFERGDNSK